MIQAQLVSLDALIFFLTFSYPRYYNLIAVPVVTVGSNKVVCVVLIYS